MAILSILCLLVTASLVLFATAYSFSKLKSRKDSASPRITQFSLYQDCDGQATWSSQNACSQKPQKIAALLLVFAGLAIAFASAVRATETSNGDDDELFAVFSCWIRVALWLFLFAQCNIFFRQAPFVTSFIFGGVIAVSTALLVVDLIRESSEMLFLYQQLKPSRLELKPWIIMGSGVGTQILIGILAIISCLSIARRPAVFWDGQVVDGRDTVSVIQRYTFAWARPIFSRARGLLQMELQDLPAIGFGTRTKNLQYRFLKSQTAVHERLWRTIIRAHRNTFSWAAVITLMSSLAGYAPHLCMYKALSLLELQQQDGRAYISLWFWAVALGFSLLTQQILDIRLEWLTVTRLEIPVRSQLSAIIYRKLMRMKDVRCGQQSGENDAESIFSKSGSSDALEVDVENEKEHLLFNGQNSSQESSQAKPKDKDSKKAMTPPSPPEKSNRAVVNLIAIDAARIADFCCRCHVLLSSIAMLCIAITALVRLLGWISMGTGLITVILLFPANYKVSKAYSQAQVALMKHRDSRNAMVTDALVGIRQVKFSATEAWWIQNIMKIRDSELKQQRWVFVWIIALRLYWIMSPILFSVASLTAYSWNHGSLSASVAFTALGVFNSLESALSSMPFAVSQLLETLVSCKRIEQHIHEFESPRYLSSGENIRFENATLAWPTQDNERKGRASFMLRGLTASIPRGKFCIIYGRSGSGKTLLLNSIIGEADLISGNLYAPEPPLSSRSSSLDATSPKWINTSSVAYLAQVPWLENKTIQANILFGLPFDGSRYEKVIAAAALHDDLNTFDQGDMTEIGPQGTTLSGGQRFRIALAKALYSRAEILVLDDIFSAVDAHVGRHILEEGLLGELCKERTVVLATHHVSLCMPRAHYAIEIRENGEILESNLEQVRKNFPTSNLLKGATDNYEDVSPSEDRVSVVDSASMKPLVEEEFRESGVVKWFVYDRYIKSSGGWPIWVLAFAVLVASLVAMLGRGWWMNLWTRWSQDQTTSLESDRQVLNGSGSSHHLRFYLAFYIIISLSAAILEALKCAVVYVAALRASRRLFEHLISTVLRSRPRWLDITPIGRILNRTTSDFVLIDTRIPGDTHTLCSALLSLVATSIASLAVTWYLIIPEVLLWVVSLAYTAKYLHVARQIKRLDSTLKSPILSLCETSLVGRTTIRAYGQAKAYEQLMFEHIDNLSRAGWSFAVVSCWMSVRLGLIAALFATAVAVTIVFRNVDASLAGFALGLSLGLTKIMDNAIRRYASLTLNMNSTERVVEFCDVETENFMGSDAPEGWPFEGKVCINSLSVSYAPDHPLAIKDVNVNIAARESIGIVGRTGAGKSSLSLAMFRILEARSGGISIDGIDISTINLQQLRSRMSIIPQDPSLFSGTIRSNLDPTGQYSDCVLRDSLRRVHLLEPPTGTEDESNEKLSNESQVLVGDLDTRITEGGSNLSQGQRQLLCLARATISQCKITLMDEATSAVDMHTDALIQSSLKEHFHESTLIVIAHRLSTVADFDKILVMAEGQAVEFDTPSNLLRKGGEFCKLVEASGERDKIHAMIRNSLI